MSKKKGERQMTLIFMSLFFCIFYIFYYVDVYCNIQEKINLNF